MEEGTLRVEHATRHGHSLALLMLDLDHFKLINDTHGHQIGDAVLARTAATIKTLLSPTDIFARLGGEEFAILICDASDAHLQHFATGILNAIRALTFEDIKPGLKLTLSIGIATSEKSTATLSELLGAADRELYSAKEKGRDRWIASPHNLLAA